MNFGLRDDKAVEAHGQSNAARYREMEIAFVRVITSKNDSSKSVAIGIRLLDKTNADKVKTYDLYKDSNNRMYIRNSKGEPIENNVKKVESLWTILDIGEENTKKMVINEYGEDVEIDVLPSFTGKKIGCFLKLKKVYKQKTINGIDLYDINWQGMSPEQRQDAYTNPENVKIPNYDKEPQLVFEVVDWFDVKTKMNGIETINKRKNPKTKAVALSTITKRYKDYKVEANKMTNEELDKYVENKLRYNLAKIESETTGHKVSKADVRFSVEQEERRQYFASNLTDENIDGDNDSDDVPW